MPNTYLMKPVLIIIDTKKFIANYLRKQIILKKKKKRILYVMLLLL